MPDSPEHCTDGTTDGAAHYTDGTTDPLAAELAAIAHRNEQLRTRYGHVGGLLVLTKAQHDVPRLLAAVSKVLEIHKPADHGRVMLCCEGCEETDMEGCQEWPCPTYQAIAAGLLGQDQQRGEEPGNGRS
jgi:hypothetical protein